MAKTVNLFIPELVPLANKGEEAIVRGIADVLYPVGNCEIHLLDDVEAYSCNDGIHVYPVKWFMSPWLKREFGLGASWEKIRDSLSSLVRNALHKLWPAWVVRRCGPLTVTAVQLNAIVGGQVPTTQKEQCLKRLVECDFVVAGHDGALEERVCQIIEVMSGIGKDVGIFGVEFPTSFKSPAIVDVQYKALRPSRFFYCRTEASRQIAKTYFPEIDASVLPDPAFGMKPATDEEVDEIIVAEGLREFFAKPVVMCTSCEPAPISRHCFEAVKRPGPKLAAHRAFFASLIEHIVERYDVNVLFLPHATGPGLALDDRIIAHDILRRTGLPTSRAIVFNSPRSARELKGLIKRGEFLIAERIHSMIGAVGVSTPFLCMGSNTDRRVHGIIEEMLGLTDNVFFLNSPSQTEVRAKFDAMWTRRDEIRAQLSDVFAGLSKRLELKAVEMRKCIDNTLD